MHSYIFTRTLALSLIPVFSFAQQGQSTPDAPVSDQPAEHTALKVEPGAPVIKPHDIYEGTGYFHPFTRMPRYVFRDQKAAWTSPFHTSKANAKWWVIFGLGTGALIATDKHTVKELPNTSTQLSIGTWASRLGSAYSVIPISTAFYVVGTHTHQERF